MSFLLLLPSPVCLLAIRGLVQVFVLGVRLNRTPFLKVGERLRGLRLPRSPHMFIKVFDLGGRGVREWFGGGPAWGPLASVLSRGEIFDRVGPFFDLPHVHFPSREQEGERSLLAVASGLASSTEVYHLR